MGGDPIKTIRGAACLALVLAATSPSPPTVPASATVPAVVVQAGGDDLGGDEVQALIADQAGPDPGREPGPEPPGPDAPQAAPVAVAGYGSVPVVASWYGPGLYGNRTACSQPLTTSLLGLAHRTLPCGTLVTLRYGTRTVAVPVVDRGPFNYTREFDLTYAAKVALGCPDICSLEWLR